MKKRIASLTSNIFSPFLIALALILLVSFEATVYVSDAIKWSLISTALSILPIFLFTVYLVRHNRLDSVFASVRKQRTIIKELGDLRSNAVYIRQGSTIRLASPEEIGRFLAERQVLVYGKAQLQEIKEELDKSPERGELLALEEKLRMDMERVQRQLIEIGADWEKLGKAIQNPRGILSIIFSNSDHGRAANIIGMGDLSINYQTMQSHRNVEKIKDLVSAWQALLVQLYQVQYRLKRPSQEIDLYKIDGRY